MTRRNGIWVLAGLLLAAQVACAAAPSSARLTAKQRSALLEQVIPAYRLGEPQQLLRFLSATAAKLDEPRLAAADRLLAEHDVPGISQMLADTRLALVQQGRYAQLPKPNSRELLLTLRALDKETRSVLQGARTHAVMSDPLPFVSDMTAYRKLFWEIHVLENRLKNVQRTNNYAVQLSEQAVRLNRRTLSAADQKLLDTNFKKRGDRLELLRQDLEEREMEMRFYRVQDAEEVLSNSRDTRQRLLAAHALVMDAALLKQFFARSDRARIREDLNDPSLPEAVESAAAQGRKAGGDLIEKGETLAVALHWWMRGRYGAGPNAFGLVKADGAARSPQTLFPLYMPVDRPVPTDPVAAGPAIPQVDRRHHYAWAAEYRPFITSATTSGHKLGRQYTEKETRITHLSRFY